MSVIFNNNGLNIFTLTKKFHFINKKTITPIVLVYETYGTLSPDKDNVVLIHHALSSSSHVNSHPKNSKRGWWEDMIGPNKAIDTNRYYVICINNLGSCFGSSGPGSIDPNSMKIYGNLFPAIDIADIVKTQKLLLNHLGIDKLFAVIGGSMGGMLSLTWSILYPGMAKKLILISTSYKAYPSNIVYRSIQRDIIQFHLKSDSNNLNFLNFGFVIARKYALLNYRNFNNLDKCFDSTKSIYDYLEKNANLFVKKFNVYSYLYFLNALDQFNICNYTNDDDSVFKRIISKTLIVSINSDSLYPTQQQEDLYHAIKLAGGNVKYICHKSDYGHDAFLIEVKKFGKYISDFLRKNEPINRFV